MATEHGTGLLITPDHERVLDSLHQVPVAFGAAPSDLPPRWVPPLVIESQGRTNSCAGHAEALACSHANYVKTGEVVRFSRRFAYLTAQARGGFIGRDQGTSIGSTLSAATNDGCCRETICPFQEYYSTKLDDAARQEAEQHRHQGDQAYDLRNWERMLAWVSDRRAVIIGAKWMGAQDSCNGIEDLATGSRGGFRGYHARCVIGHDTYRGELVPVVQNSHGTDWGDNGRAVILPELWVWWCSDPNFTALGFSEIDEIQPQRRSWSHSLPGDAC